MDAFREYREAVAGDPLRFAILVGLATVPFTVAFSWQPAPDEATIVGGTVSGAPLLVAGALVGYRYGDCASRTRRAGIWAGLAASVATVLLYAATAVLTIGAASTTTAAFAVVLTPIAVVIGVGLTVLVTAATAVVVGWMRRRTARASRGRDATGKGSPNALESRWWLPVVAYVLLVPTVALAEGLVEPDGGAGFAVALLLIGTVLLSVPAALGVFVDATVPRCESAWLPSVRAYVGLPVCGFAVAYVGATLYGSPRPSAPAGFGFLVALWLTAAAYLANRYRHRGRVAGERPR
ncbi:DUF5518 domain-containing protein [Natronococcus sp. A-GB7]|uniref:DUF5518 domain-containing protein n=1 Tax=Natronococcus sp. A-GB7 TaxID=3037649 RepID=UPI00241F26A7|nr:DUF5518 domain-containing protein [Natronococcus sp. A-GB7]MDG5821681.1 DUF5518 domain-containing protein [Natronococcus sp. A-GB7]